MAHLRIIGAAGDTEPLLLEAKVFEPSLFLATFPGSAERFAEAALQRQKQLG